MSETEEDGTGLTLGDLLDTLPDKHNISTSQADRLDSHSGSPGETMSRRKSKNVGLSIGVIVGIGICCFCCYGCLKNRGQCCKKKRRSQDSDEEEEA